MSQKKLFMSLGIVSFGILVFLAFSFQKQRSEIVPQVEVVSSRPTFETAINSVVAQKGKGAEIVAKTLGAEIAPKKYKYQDDPTFDLEKLSGLQDSTNIHYRGEFYGMKETMIITNLMENPIEDEALSAVLEYEITYDMMFGIDFPEERRKPLRENHYQMKLKQLEHNRFCNDEEIKAKKITLRECVKREQETFDTYHIDGLKRLLTDDEFKLAFDGKSKDEVQHGYWNFYEMAGISKEE